MINVITPQRAYNIKVCKYLVILIILIIPLTFKFLVSEVKANTSDLVSMALEAEMLIKNKQYKEAANLYYKIAKKKKDEDTALRATRIAGLANDYNLMLTASDLWLKYAKDKKLVHHVRIPIYSKLEKIKPAAKEAIKILKLSNDRDKFALVYDTLLSIKPIHAEEIFKYIFERYSNGYLASFYYTQLLVLNGNYENAIDVLKNVKDEGDFKKEKEYRWYFLEAKAFYELGKTEEALRVLRGSLDLFPENKAINDFYVEILVDEKLYKDAIGHYRFMVGKKIISFKDIDVAKNISRIHIELEDYESANSFIDALKNKNFAEYSLLKVMLFIKQKKINKAKNVFSQIEINSSEYIESFFYIVEFLVENKGYQLSNSFFQKEITKEHNTNSMLRLYLIMSETLFSNDKFIEARNITNNGLEIFLKNERLLYMRALAEEKLGNLKGLEKDLKTILESDPNNANALNALGYTWAENNINLDQAEKYLTKALELEPHEPAIMDSMGWILYKKNKYLESEKYIRRAYARNKDPEIIKHLIIVLIELDKIEEAKHIFKKHKESVSKYEDIIQMQNILK